MKQVEVIGMSCAHCVKAVTEALEELSLQSVNVSLETGLATFDAADIGADKITAAIDDAGFEVGAMV